MVGGNSDAVHLALFLTGACFALGLLLSVWKMSRALLKVQSQLDQLMENIRISNTPVIISEPAVFSDRVQQQVHTATQHLRNQNVMLQSMMLRAQDQIEKTIRGLGARVTALTGAVDTIEQMYEATAGCINDVFQAMDDVMRKENSLFQEHTAVVARAVKDLETTFRNTLATHKQMFEGSGFSHVTYFNDILRINRIQLHLTQALARYMQDADAKRQQLEAHAEQLLEQHIGAVLTPQAAATLLDELKTQISGNMDTATGATVDRCMKMLPEYVKTNLVHGIHYVLQAQTNPDDGSILTNMRKMYLALQPTRILAQNAQQGVPQSALDDMQGSLQLWLESQIVQKVDAVIDLLAKVQVELSAFNDTSGANHTARVSADLEKIIACIEQLFERHESHKDRAMEASSQSHALMNHVKQTNGLANSCLNQVNQVSNSQWTHSDQLAGLQESLREQDDKLKKQSDAFSKVQG
ncbi:unnamed protein product, partial [Symbiodinium sp. KB8]